jgi:hypothetical protein
MTTTHEVVSPLLRVGQKAQVIDLPVTLEEPTNRIVVHTPGLVAGRANAVVGEEGDDGERVWAAKHHWTEGRGDDVVTVYEFDEALPPGRVLLRIPV